MVEKQGKLEVEWTETARNQYFNILDYWTERNKSTKYAEKLISTVRKKTKIISSSPYSAPQTNFPNTRKSILGHFSILYKITEEKIIITAF